MNNLSKLNPVWKVIVVLAPAAAALLYFGFASNPVVAAVGLVSSVIISIVLVTRASESSAIEKNKVADLEGQVAAMNRSQAVIEFDLDGNILTANDNFLSAMGYSLEEIQGKHHRLFVETEYANSSEYRQFWEKLNRGEFMADEFKRIAKGGREVWIQASYNPVLNASGTPFKVVKYATDVTEQKIRNADYRGQIDAIGKSQAVIEFEMDGTIVAANDNFLNAVGYTLDEVKGKHHRIFVDSEYANSTEYSQFWEKLNRGEFFSDEFKRIGKGGREVWIQASYNPIMDLNGKPLKVVKYATEITQQKMQNADYRGQIDAIGKSQAVIEFNMDGTILTANDNFLNTLGYTLDEVKGKHHSLFVEPAVAASEEYRSFWAQLNRGEYMAKEFKRIGKGGKEVWIQASYNPIMDLNGKPFKVVKYATEITEQKMQNADYRGQIDAIGKSQAVIEFEMDGTIITANDNFLSTLGYTIDEIKGKHHSLFVDAVMAASPEYKAFWAQLNSGEFLAKEFKRIAKGGREVWIQASYNPIMDLNGKPFKVVKYATEITQQKLQSADFSGQIEAIGKSQAVIEFEMDGTVISANENFLGVMGYSLDEVKGKHHSLFVEPSYAGSAEYKAFWAQLNRGEYMSEEFKRVAKGGKEVWIQASYNPIMDLNGKPFKVVKYATDITQQKMQNSDYRGQIEAIGKSQAVIEFEMDGTVISANENFLSVMGYTIDEIQGKHHSLFVDPSYAASSEYKSFWARLNRGEHTSEEFKRIAKGGKEVWIQASYNPIMDLNGHPFKVVKFASDITEQKHENILNSMIRQGLENVTANVMLLGPDHTVTYMNQTLEELFRRLESDFRKELPRFDAQKLSGSAISVLDSSNAAQSERLADMTGNFDLQLKYGEAVLQVKGCPLMDGSECIGTVIQWTDRTQELAIEEEIQSVVSRALVGDLSLRIDMSGKDGFFERLSGIFNQLMEVSENVISDTLRVLEALAKGDLSETIEAEYQGTFNKLKSNANATVIKLTEVVGQIQGAAGSVKTGSDEISQGNADLSQRTEEQASSLEETASSMEEMTSTVKQNADNASQANQLVVDVREQAEKGGKVVSEAVSAMQEINTSSKKIADIISVIDEIAFQTNLLALNAAVEAARAGEQGRGFAVVASEVRNLAGRSATAAKEIKTLIEDSGRKVEEGSRLVNNSGQTLDEIVEGVRKVSEIVGEIAAASQEQASGIDEVNKAIMQMDELTQQNASLVEEAAAASESLGEQADGLTQMISFFNVGGDGYSEMDDHAFNGSPASAVRVSAKPNYSAPVPSKNSSQGGGSDWEEF